MKKNKFCLFAAVALLASSCGGGGRASFGDNEYPVVTVGTSNTTMQSTYPATIKGVQDVEIHPKVQGFITQIHVKEGQTVSAGQILFVLDNVTYQAQVRQASRTSGRMSVCMDVWISSLTTSILRNILKVQSSKSKAQRV